MLELDTAVQMGSDQEGAKIFEVSAYYCTHNGAGGQAGRGAQKNTSDANTLS